MASNYSSAADELYHIHCRERLHWPSQKSFWAPFLRRPPCITWRSPSRQVGIRFLFSKIWKPRSRRRRGPYVSKPNALKFNHQVFLGNLLTRSTNFTVFGVLCFPAVIFIFKIWTVQFRRSSILHFSFFPRIRRLVRNRSSTIHHEIGRQVK